MKRTPKRFYKLELNVYYFLLASIEVTMSPKPIPAIMEPTNQRTDILRTANPIPTPKSVPPPMAQVLLSLSLFAINYVLDDKSTEPMGFII